jgi:hypothetical protein
MEVALQSFTQERRGIDGRPDPGAKGERLQVAEDLPDQAEAAGADGARVAAPANPGARHVSTTGA